MSGKRKVRIEQVVEIAKRCSQGEFSINSISRKLGLNYETIREWVLLYESHGTSAFVETGKNNLEQSGDGSMIDINVKSDILSPGDENAKTSTQEK